MFQIMRFESTEAKRLRDWFEGIRFALKGGDYIVAAGVGYAVGNIPGALATTFATLMTKTFMNPPGDSLVPHHVALEEHRHRQEYGLRARAAEAMARIILRDSQTLMPRWEKEPR